MKINDSTKNPVVSVVIALYNPARTIHKCIESILRQTYKNLEIIVVDAKAFPEKRRNEYRPFIEKHASYFLDGPERCIQRNRGIVQAKGEYILLVDQDMYLSPTVVEDCYTTMKKNDYIALLIPEISIGSGFWTKCVAFDRYIRTYLEQGANECCRFFKKSDALAIGSYDPEMVGVEDSDFHYRMEKRGKIGKITSIIYHDEGQTRFWQRVKKKYYYSKAFRKYVKKYPSISVNQFFPVKAAYFKHWKLLVKDPAVTLGMFLLRGAEVTAGGMGIFLEHEK